MVILNRVKPGKYPAESSLREYAEFVKAWQERDFMEMSRHCQGAWLDGQQKPEETLYNFFGLYRVNKLIHVEHPEREEDLPDVFEDIKALIEFSFQGKKVKKKMLARLAWEEGKWGVNPISALRMSKT